MVSACGAGSRAFYWAQYERHLLQGKGWQPDAVAGLDEDTRKIVERISDPTRTAAFPARGLVVGYVQSGKTANFTGVIAKGIDAGYRLVIVLAGTLDILREQTQRRLDMELVGKENILQDWDENDPDLEPHDYAVTPTGRRSSSASASGPPTETFRTSSGSPGRQRLPKARPRHRRARDAEENKLKPLNEADNLFPCGARLAVVKKNATVLKRLVSDLKKVRRQLGEIPTLIIDDESDQASVNTTDPRKWKEGETSGPASTACSQSCSLCCQGTVHRLHSNTVCECLRGPRGRPGHLPQGLPAGAPQARGYMGVADFHDIDVVYAEGERNPGNSNEKAFVRDLRATPTTSGGWNSPPPWTRSCWPARSSCTGKKPRARRELPPSHHVGERVV